MSEIYNEGSRRLQDRFDTRRLADRLEERMVHDRFTETDRAFIERLDMFFLATVDAEGQPSCSYKGGDPGFVRVIDDTSLVFPNYDGNGMFPRYIHKLALVERSRFVPHVEQETPVPDWKRSDWARDALPANDPARRGSA